METERWHTTMLGKDVALVTLIPTRREAAQAEWLEAELKRLRPAVRWLFVYHRPMYPAVKGLRACPHFCPLFDKYNIDIAESDGHCMKRTVPIRDGKGSYRNRLRG